MRVFISADIEGIATTTLWDQCSKGQIGYAEASDEMTKEVVAACEGAIAAGADYIRVKDAHGSGTNIDPQQLPECVELTRSSCGSPWSMVYGITDGFDAALFIGYHAAAGREGNPLSHTETKSTVYVKLNGEKCSEFTLFSYAAAMAGVPSVLVTGDQMLCDDVADSRPALIALPVKRGYGGSTTSLQPKKAQKLIREAAEKALRQDFAGKVVELPKHFTFEICYKEHTQAARASFFPGFKKIGDNTVLMETDDFYEVMRAVVWVL